MVVAALILAQLVGLMELSMTYSAVPSFYRLFGNSEQMAWLFTGFQLVAGISAAVFGGLGDAVGRRRVLILVLIVAGLGSAISMVGLNLTWIIVGRTLQGVTIAITPLCVGLLRERLRADSVPRAIGFLIIAAHSVSGFFFLLGGALVDHVGWRCVFGTTTVATVVSIVVLRWALGAELKTSVGRVRDVDWIGAVGFGCGAAALLFAIDTMSKLGPLHWTVLLGAILSAVLLTFWIYRSLHQSEPLIDFRMLGQRHVAATLAIFTVLCMGVQQFPITVLLLLQQPIATGAGLGLSATAAGAVNIPACLSGAAAGVAAGILSARLGGRAVLLISTCLLTVGWALFYFYPASLSAVFGGVTIVYAGIAGLFTGVNVLLAQSVPGNRVSSVIGLSEVIRSLGNAVGAQIVSLTFARLSIHDAILGGAFPSAAAYSIVFGTILLICLTAIPAILLAPLGRRGDLGVVGPHH